VNLHCALAYDAIDVTGRVYDGRGRGLGMVSVVDDEVGYRAELRNDIPYFFE
jgi:hypothetical protein